MSISEPRPFDCLPTPPPSPSGLFFQSTPPPVKAIFLDELDFEDFLESKHGSQLFIVPEVWGAESIKLPRPHNKSAVSNLDSFRRRPPLGITNIGSKSKSSGSLRSPDRFLPKRSPLDAAYQRFHASKDAHKLSPVEKLLRQDNASTDAFSPRRRATSPNPSTTSATLGHTSGHVSVGGPTALPLRRDSTSVNGERRVSLGSTWTVGGLAPLSIGVSNGRGGLISSGTNAPLYTTSFSTAVPRAEEDRDQHEGRLAKALELDRTQRVYDFADLGISTEWARLRKRKHSEDDSKTIWNGTEWIMEGRKASKSKLLAIVQMSPDYDKGLIIAIQNRGKRMKCERFPQPLSILDAPNLRDDFYCSVLAYSPTCHTLAVGLGTMLYAWSEKQGVHLLNAGSVSGSWLTSIAFSSTQGCKCILAFGRSDGTLTLMSLYDRPLPRFEVQQPYPIACVTWRPTVTLRQSRSHVTPGLLVKNEDLVVGDETGNVYYYSVEWPEAWEVDRNGWSGVMTLLARISIHSQQICGLAWSHDGTLLATGGNDNLCCLFKASRILQSQSDDPETEEESFTSADGVRQVQSTVGRGHVKIILTGAEKHQWIHGAAVKAIAFCPWRDGLVATGGGSNDKCIHFFHTVSGACLATISVAAQVTSLIWSTTRREIAATFGYAQPEHPYRIAVFSWPECKQVAAIPWEGEHRALYAISYPGGPNESHSSHEGGSTLSRTAQEGCIVVAASDESVKFHEVWGSNRKATVGGEGLLGGSDILEGLEGIDKEGELIR